MTTLKTKLMNCKLCNTSFHYVVKKSTKSKDRFYCDRCINIRKFLYGCKDAISQEIYPDLELIISTTSLIYDDPGSGEDRVYHARLDNVIMIKPLLKLFKQSNIKNNMI